MEGYARSDMSINIDNDISIVRPIVRLALGLSAGYERMRPIYKFNESEGKRQGTEQKVRVHERKNYSTS